MNQPLAAGLPGFRKFTTRYVQNHVEDLPVGREPLFDGVTMTTQVPREEYSRGFFNEPDYERKMKPDEIYLFDLTKTVSVLGREEVVRNGEQSAHKAPILSSLEAFKFMRLSTLPKLVLDHLDRSTASILGFGAGDFQYDLLGEVWFGSIDARDSAVNMAHSRGVEAGIPTIVLPVREVVIFGSREALGGA
jgi:hypothetical protein